jgi:hypothetical protein
MMLIIFVLSLLTVMFATPGLERRARRTLEAHLLHFGEWPSSGLLGFRILIIGVVCSDRAPSQSHGEEFSGSSWQTGTLDNQEVLFVTLTSYPISPSNAKWLKPEFRSLAVARVAKNGTGIKTTTFNAKQGLSALTDIKAWMLSLAMFGSSVPNGVLSESGLPGRGLEDIQIAHRGCYAFQPTFPDLSSVSSFYTDLSMVNTG